MHIGINRQEAIYVRKDMQRNSILFVLGMTKSLLFLRIFNLKLQVNSIFEHAIEASIPKQLMFHIK